MDKSDQKRSEILEKLADYVLAEGLSASSLRPLAEAADTSDRMLLYYFKDKAEIIAATLERVAERMMLLMNEAGSAEPMPYEELLERFRKFLFADRFWPYMCLWLEIAALAAREDAFYRAVGEKLGRGFLEWGASQLKSPTPEQREADAARLLVVIEGMVLLKSLGLQDVSAKAV